MNEELNNKIMINMLRNFMGKGDSMQEQMANGGRTVEILKIKKKKKKLAIKNTTMERKNAFMGLLVLWMLSEESLCLRI